MSLNVSATGYALMSLNVSAAGYALMSLNVSATGYALMSLNVSATGYALMSLNVSAAGYALMSLTVSATGYALMSLTVSATGYALMSLNIPAAGYAALALLGSGCVSHFYLYIRLVKFVFSGVYYFPWRCTLSSKVYMQKMMHSLVIAVDIAAQCCSVVFYIIKHSVGVSCELRNHS